MSLISRVEDVLLREEVEERGRVVALVVVLGVESRRGRGRRVRGGFRRGTGVDFDGLVAGKVGSWLETINSLSWCLC